MTNQEIEKRFEEKFPFELWHEGGLVSKNDDILAFIQSEINLALANRNKDIANAMKDDNVTCPKAYGFEGKDTFSDCGKCIVCELLTLTAKE